MLSRNAMGNLINRYAAVLKKCRLLNVFGSLAMGFESKFFDHVPEYPDFVVGGVPDVGPPAEFSHNLKKEQNLIWDSGEVPSGESVWVEYGGPQLESRKDYFWNDKGGQA